MQYFGKMRHTSATLVSFAKALKVTNNSEISNSPDTLWKFLLRFADMAWSLTGEVLTTQMMEFLEASGYRAEINFTFTFR